MEELANLFKKWNTLGKSAICRFILEQLGITAEEFSFLTKNWETRKLIHTDKGFEVIIKPIYIKAPNGSIVDRRK